MSVISRNNVVLHGHGERVMMFAHGFGCDQNMWRYIWPAFQDQYKILLFDHVGAGKSDISSYSVEKYDSLEGYVDDIIEILHELNFKDIVFVGHSVSALMGILGSAKTICQFFSQFFPIAVTHYYRSHSHGPAKMIIFQGFEQFINLRPGKSSQIISFIYVRRGGPYQNKIAE